MRRGVTSPIHPTADSRLILKTTSFQLARHRAEWERPPSGRRLTSAAWGAIVSRVGAGLATPKARFEFIGSHRPTAHLCPGMTHWERAELQFRPHTVP